MKIADFFKISLNSLKASKKRTLLTVVGIVIGVSSVIVIASVGAGAESLILDQIVSSGANTINVLPGFSDPAGPPASAMGISVDTLKKEEAEELEVSIKNIDAVSSYVRGVASAKYQNKSGNFSFVGTDDDYQKIDGFQMLWKRGVLSFFKIKMI
jgi:putative ABC transport system permease protein